MLGYDIHPEYQRGIRLDLGKTQQGAGFVWIKVADGGRAYVSPNGYNPGAQAGAAHVAGLPAGGYSYAQPGDGAAHAEVLLAECARWQLTGLVPVTDIEDNVKIHTWSTGEAVSYGRAFCARVRAKGIRPGVYMNASKMQACRPDQWPENPVIWCARYGAKPEDGGRYTGRYDVHQYSSSGSVPGSAGSVDLNQSYTTALFTGANQGGQDMAFTDADFHALMWDYRFDDDGKGHTGNFAQAIKGIRDTVNATAAAVAKGSAVTAAEIAAAILPALQDTVREQLVDVTGLDEQAVADRLAVDLANRLAQ